MTRDLTARVKNCKHLTYGDLIKAPEGIKNTPREKVWQNLELMARKCIEPLLDEFPDVELKTVYRSTEYEKFLGLPIDKTVNQSNSYASRGESFEFYYDGYPGELAEFLCYKSTPREIVYIEDEERDYYQVLFNGSENDDMFMFRYHKLGHWRPEWDNNVMFCKYIEERKGLKCRTDDIGPNRKFFKEDDHKRYYFHGEKPDETIDLG